MRRAFGTATGVIATDLVQGRVANRTGTRTARPRSGEATDRTERLREPRPIRLDSGVNFPMKVDTPARMLFFCTVRLTGTSDADPLFYTEGTGFIYEASRTPGVSAPVLVTARHVVEGTSKIEVSILRRASSVQTSPIGCMSVPGRHAERGRLALDLSCPSTVEPFVDRALDKLEVCAVGPRASGAVALNARDRPEFACASLWH